MTVCPSCARQMPPQCRYCALCGALLPHSLPTGQLFVGRFQILKLLSQGQRHTLTFHAVERPSGEQFILREVREDLRQDPLARQELMKELKRLSQLQIPGISPIRGFVRHEGRGFLLMPFVTGHTLRQIVAHQGPLTPEQARAVLRAAAKVLKQLHGALLLHLDISPDTLLLSGWDHVTLLDGAWLKALNNPFSHAAPVYRTDYAAPETLRGRTLPASDWYSLGLSVLEALTHTPAESLFDAERNQVEWEPIGDKALEAALRGLLAAAPRERISDAEKLLQTMGDVPQQGAEQHHTTLDLPHAAPEPISRIGPDSNHLSATAPLNLAAESAGTEISTPKPSATPTATPQPSEAPTQGRSPVKLVENIEELSPEEGLDALLSMYEELNS